MRHPRPASPLSGYLTLQNEGLTGFESPVEPIITPRGPSYRGEILGSEGKLHVFGVNSQVRLIPQGYPAKTTFHKKMFEGKPKVLQGNLQVLP